MDIDTADIGEIDPESAVLFLGSGFSLGATNIAGASPPNGKGLRRHFIPTLNLEPGVDYDLQVLSEEFAAEDSHKLKDELYRLFRLTALSPAQTAILNEPWRRIYSTNYDDAVELHRINRAAAPNTYDVSEPIPTKLPHGAVVHLHGSIRLITQDNVKESLVLGEASYVNHSVVRSPWYEQFQRDVAYASALFVVGYSLSDYHIAGLLLANPHLAKRTLFIQGPGPDPTFIRRTAQYGQTRFIGVDGFAAALAAAPRRAAPALDSLRSFRSLADMLVQHPEAFIKGRPAGGLE